MDTMIRLDVNTKPLIGLTNKLNNLHRSAFPSAVRNTLNECAFDMKRKEIPLSFKTNMKPKSGTIPFVKKTTGVQKATGFKVDNMSSIVGFLVPSGKADKAFVEGLYKQEKGGIIDDGLRYLKAARGDKINGKVKLENYYDKSKVISGRSRVGRNKGTRKSKFVARAYMAYKKGLPMFMNTLKGNFLVKVKGMSSDISTKKLNFDFEFIAMSRNIKKSNIKRTDFVKEAREKQVRNIDKIYKKQAEFQIRKHTR